MYDMTCFREIFLRVCLLMVSFSLVAGADEPLVETSLGRIQGTIMQSEYGIDIYAFRGIPYAEPPLNELRFRAPVAKEPWTETLQATSDSLVCPQTGIKLLMTEDCLKLNVFSPNLTGSAPVMVYIHGGANVLGSGHSSYEAGPQYLLDHDVVLVAFNYRLGALGFLSTRTEEAPGNFGYLDQVMALKWVKTHIANFGGNPESVTIFGMSAGSMAVTLHMASPLSRGLFHRAIAMSGSATNHYAIDNLFWTRKLAREVSCPMYNPKDVVDCLRELDWGTIVDACSKWEPYGFINMKWNYEVDGRFLMKHPTDVFNDGDFNKVNLLAGFTMNELDFTTYHQQSNIGLLDDININFDQYAPEIFLYNASDNVNEWTDMKKSDQIKEFYLGVNGNLTSERMEDFGRMFSDSILGHGVHRLVELARKHVNVYYYRMDYVGSRSIYNDDNNNPRGVGHADDLQYVMPGSWYGSQMAVEHPDMFMVNRLTSWWTTFARTGTPIEFYIPNGYWEPSTENQTFTLYNNKEYVLSEELPYPERYALWDEMFPVEKSSGTRTTRNFLVITLVALIPITLSRNLLIAGYNNVHYYAIV